MKIEVQKPQIDRIYLQLIPPHLTKPYRTPTSLNTLPTGNEAEGITFDLTP